MDTMDITITATPGAGDTCSNKVWLVIVKLWVWLTSVKCNVTVRLCLLIICMGGAVPAEQYNIIHYISISLTWSNSLQWNKQIIKIITWHSSGCGYVCRHNGGGAGNSKQ